jgi:hypothetical protein
VAVGAAGRDPETKTTSETQRRRSARARRKTQAITVVAMLLLTALEPSSVDAAAGMLDGGIATSETATARSAGGMVAAWTPDRRAPRIVPRQAPKRLPGAGRTYAEASIGLTTIPYQEVSKWLRRL